MNEWNQAIQEIKHGLANNYYRNEMAVSQSIVRRIIGFLGWDINNPTIVAPEYTCGNFGRVDYALLDANSNPKVLIEVKAIGKISDGITEQIARYGYATGAAIIVLTDGQEWHFYYAAAGDVSMQERRFYKIDVSDRDSDEIYSVMQKYLGKNAILNGDAFRAAESMYRDTSLKRKAKTLLPVAFKALVDTEDSELYRLISEKVADLGGVLPEQSSVASYFQSLLTQTQRTTAQPTQPDRAPIGQRPTSFSNMATIGHKASRSNFRMLGLKAGDELTATFNPNLRFRVADETNQIVDLQTGEVCPISRMANQYLGGSRNGYEYFRYKGKKLSDIRQEFDSNYLRKNNDGML